MEILIYPIKSILTNDDLINNVSKQLLNELINENKEFSFRFIDSFDKVEDQSILILVQSGGSENYFKEQIFKKYKGPYYLLTYGASNSLAAALEILSFIKQNGYIGEVIHGDIKYIAKRIEDIYNLPKMKHSKLGVIGKPSDWLIASTVDYEKALRKFNIELIDISDSELIDLYNQEQSIDSDLNYDKKELSKSLKIQKALKKLIKKYNLDGFTIRCFDMIQKTTSTACLSLAMFNDQGIIAICEGDIPTMLTASLIHNLLNVPFFQVNPQFINPTLNTVEFAHCTIPFKMCKCYELTTHFESGIGVAIHGELEMQDVTIVKIDSGLNLFYLAKGKIIENEYRMDRCRTQIKVKMENDVTYFLTSSLANHHLIIYGDHVEELKSYFKSFGLTQVI